MSKISLKRIISKKEVSSLLNGLSNFSGTDLCIKDAEQNIIAGNYSCDSHYIYPVDLDGNIIGWVCGEENARVIAGLLNHIASIELEKKALANETLHKYKEITMLYDFSEKAASCLDSKEISRFVISEAKRLIKADNISVMLSNDDSDAFEVITHNGKETYSEEMARLQEGVAVSVMETGKAEIINDIKSDSRYASNMDDLISVMFAPLKVKDKSIGVVKLGSRSRMEYSAEDLKLFTSLASQTAVAIENARLYENLKDAFIATVHTLAETIEKRDPYTGGHTKRVMQYSLAIGRASGLSDDEMRRLELAAVLHDIGKIGVRDSVLLKNGRLTDEEFEEIKKHTIYGEEILNHIKHFKNAIAGVKYHHERYDGRGYPDGVKGEDIDITARIIAIADTFDAMTTDRPYRKGLSLETAFEELKRCSGTQFDPELVNAFLNAFENKLIE
jgi:HD-GYP domain-containing protein (c-di-GMP phosphodiesterase class II)